MDPRRNCIFLSRAVEEDSPLAFGPTHLAIVRGPTMNYNAYDVVEIIYETFALAFASRCRCFADRLRGRTAGAPDAPSLPLSRCDAISLSVAAATVRHECRTAAARLEYAGECPAAHCCYGEQTDERRSTLRNSGSEQARFCYEPVRAEFRLRRCPRFPAGNRGQG